MRGQPQQSGRTAPSFARTALDQAIGWIDTHIRPLASNRADLEDAAGRVLAESVASIADIPSFDRAAIDGVAVRAEQTFGASSYNPLGFPLVPAGDALPRSGAARVNEGDRVPSGADAILALDYVSFDGMDRCEIIEPVAAGNAIERAASHAARATPLLPAGRRLRARDIGLLASAGIAQVPVIRQPRVRLLMTGRNLSPPGAESSAATVYDADGPLLRALIERDGGILADLHWVARDRGSLRDALATSGWDIVLVVGGTGRGPDDCAAAALAEAGELAIWGVALHPGASTGMGLVGAQIPAFLLPGTPVACLFAYELLAGRAIRTLAGRDPALPYRSRTMRSSRKIVSSIGVTEICPVRCIEDGRAEPLASFAAAGLVSAARADGFVIIPEGSEGFAAGATVTVYLAEDADLAVPLAPSSGPCP